MSLPDTGSSYVPPHLRGKEGPPEGTDCEGGNRGMHVYPTYLPYK